MSDLWTERYRPRTLDDYVWSSQAQKDAVEGYLAEGKLANLMLLGPPGTGKCLGPDEKIRIKLDVDALPDHIKKKISRLV